jgi:hypothetical protein
MPVKPVLLGRLTLSFLFLCIFCFSALSQIPDVTWEKQLNLRSSHFFTDVLELPDGNLVLLGAVEKTGEKGFDIWLLRCNSQGDTLQTAIFRNSGNNIPMRVVSLGEKGFMVAFISGSDEEGHTAGLLSTDSELNARWVKMTEQQAVIPKTDIAADNQGFVWWLNTFEGTGGKAAVSLWKMDEAGNRVLETAYAENHPVLGYAIRNLPDGTMAMTCQVQPGNGKPTVQVTRTDTEGKILWKTMVPQTEKEYTPQCLCCSPDNTLLVGGWAGLCYNPDAPAEDQIWDYDYLLSKIDPSGKIIWTHNYNREGSEKGTAVAVLPDGNIMAAGKCETSFTGSIGPWLMLVDKNGKMIKDQVYKFRYVNDQVARIICTSDGGFLVVGPGYIKTENRLTGWVKKLNPVL